MNTDIRSKLLRAAFNTAPTTIGGLECRLFSEAVFSKCLHLGLKMFGSDEDRKAMSSAEKMREMVAVFFLLSQPEEVVELATADPEEFWREWYPVFQADVPLTAIPDVAKVLQTVSEQAEAAAVSVVEKPASDHADPAEQPPGNL